MQGSLKTYSDSPCISHMVHQLLWKSQSSVESFARSPCPWAGPSRPLRSRSSREYVHNRFIRPLTASLRFIRAQFVILFHLICEHDLLDWRQDGYDTSERIAACIRLFVSPGLSECQASSDSLMANLSSISCSVDIGSTQGDARKVRCREVQHADRRPEMQTFPYLPSVLETSFLFCSPFFQLLARYRQRIDNSHKRSGRLSHKD